MHNILQSNNQGLSGIYRCRLIILNDNDIRAYIPGISNVNQYNSVEELEANLSTLAKSLPKIQWCAYNVESIDINNLDNDSRGPIYIMFENGDIQRPVVLSYSIIGGGDTSLQDNSDNYNVNETNEYVDTFSNDSIQRVIDIWHQDCNGKLYGRGINQYDCSSSIAHSYYKAGLTKVSSFNTSSFAIDYKSYGFEKINVSRSDLQPGDVLLRSGHMCMYLGNGNYTHSNPAVKPHSNFEGPDNSTYTSIYRYKG